MPGLASSVVVGHDVEDDCDASSSVCPYLVLLFGLSKFRHVRLTAWYPMDGARCADFLL